MKKNVSLFIILKTKFGINCALISNFLSHFRFILFGLCMDDGFFLIFLVLSLTLLKSKRKLFSHDACKEELGDLLTSLAATCVAIKQRGLHAY
jgi:hypothetical protein